MKVLKRYAAALLIAGALAVAPVAAAPEEGAKSAEHSEKPGMEIWKWLNFALLAGLLGYLVSKHIGPVLADRSREISDGLAAGVKAKADADSRAAGVQARLAGLGTAVEDLKAVARTDRDKEVARIRRDAELEFARIKEHAALEIEGAGKVARIMVQREAAKLAIELAQRKVQARMSADSQSELFNNFLGDLARESAKNTGAQNALRRTT